MTSGASLMRRLMLGFAAILAISLSVPAVSSGQEGDDEPEDMKFSLRIYDLAGVVQRTEDFDFRSMERQQPFFGSTPQTDFSFVLTPMRSTSMGEFAADSDRRSDDEAKQVRCLLQRMARLGEPWDVIGGRATIGIYDNRLMFVSQNEDGHRQVEALLQSLRQRPRPTLSIRVMVVELTDDYQRQLLLEPLPLAASAQQRQQLAAGISKVRHQVDLTARSGQSVAGSAGSRTGFVHAVEPVVAKSAVGYERCLWMGPTGLDCAVKAELEAESNQVNVSFRLSLVRLVAIEPAQGDLAVDKPKYAADIRAGDVRVPLNAAAIIGSSTVPALLVDPEAADERATRQVYYLLMVNLLGGQGAARQAATGDAATERP
jgi:hypothetical protein